MKTENESWMKRIPKEKFERLINKYDSQRNFIRDLRNHYNDAGYKPDYVLRRNEYTIVVVEAERALKNLGTDK